LTDHYIQLNTSEKIKTPGKLIREIRIEKGMNQLDIAAGMGINQSNISAYENGVKTPSIDWIERFCGVAGTDVLEFYIRLYRE